MAFKISKTDQKRIDGLVQKFADQKSDLQTILDELNATRDELRGVVEDIKDEMQGQYDDMSEKWLEGDRAGPTEEWIDNLGEYVSALETEVEMPDMSEVEEKLEEGYESEPSY